ncbi:polymer-forming cytoskeletal protein [Haladaptatus litoreus]|uniref:polymer-forming cytoskeletal protein n=1 Tax=Haladaptatus litoreus TaxID=553468 RepID=UPI0009707B9B|nr:polymer-forming cytoskeletal protein [Haladaptatus litoreus]
MIIGQSATVEGEVESAAQDLVLAGIVNEDVRTLSGTLTVTKMARLSGDLVYSATTFNRESGS